MGLFKENLKKMDFVENDSLHLVSALKDKIDSLDSSIIFALEDAEQFGVTAVYFRLFKDGRSPIPQIYIYDNTDNILDEKRLAEIHRDLWSFSRIPMFIVIEKTDVKIFDARKPVDTSNKEIKTSPIVPAINIASDAINLYSRKLFDSGVFWENEKNKKHFLDSTSAYTALIKNLKTVRREKFITNANLPKQTANKLLVFSLLIKYLEERGNETNENSSSSENKGYLARDFFRKNFNAEDFCNVIKQGKIIDLFDELSRHFNGKIFEWNDPNERELVQNSDLTDLALFLYGDIDLDKGQFYFWKQYSFNHLPVELISSVYEELLNERKDAVYTPELLVNTLIDEVMPQKEFERTSVKTIDVSCGSGIFLVSAFKQLVQRHRFAKFKKTGELKRLDSKELLQILKKNIYGIDIEEDAVRLTIFSLCLALCDELTPPEIWNELKFDGTFRDNFKHRNFFEYIDEVNLGTFDLVIGNPPFISLTLKKDEQGKTIGEYKEKKSDGKTEIKRVNLNDDIVSKSKQQIYPDNQTALMFLEQSPKLLKENGLLCLIMPSAPLLYNNSIEFRKHFFPKNQVFQILDFTNLDAVLFEADVPTAAIFVRKQNHNEEKSITHVTVRRTKSIEDRIFFEIDKYDFHYVSQQNALNDKHVWKCNLLGGGRLHNLIERLAKIPSIGEFLENKKKDDWISGEGYIAGDGVPADYIHKKPMIPTKAFNENRIDKSRITNELSITYIRPRNKRIYEPPHLLIKENLGTKKIPVYFSDEYLTFKDSIIGISAPKSERKILYNLYESFEKNNNLYRFFIITTSNEYSVGRGTSILEQDIMNLPYPEDKEDLKLSYVEQILCDDVLDYYIQVKAKSSNAKMNKDAETNDLMRFGEVFNKMLNSVYGKSGKYFFLNRISEWGEFFITEFNYGVSTNDVEIERINEPSDSVRLLIETEYGRNAFIIKILKLYERNKVYLIKPKNLRYWLRSIALKDADETFSDLLKAGY